MLTDIQIAQRAFPQFRVHGTGTVAVVKTCSESVELCADDISARIIAAEQCCRYCNHRHSIRHRKAAPQVQVLDRTGYGDD